MIATAMSLALSVVPLQLGLDYVDRDNAPKERCNVISGERMSVREHRNGDYHGNRMMIDDYLDWLDEELDDYEDEEWDEEELESEAFEIKDTSSSNKDEDTSCKATGGSDCTDSCYDGECFYNDFSWLTSESDSGYCNNGSCEYYDYDDDYDYDGYDDYDDDYDYYDDDYDDDWDDDYDYRGGHDYYDDWDDDYDDWDDWDDYDDYDDWGHGGGYDDGWW